MTTSQHPIAVPVRSIDGAAVGMSEPFAALGCSDCRNRNPLPVPITMAFQPIIDISTHSIFGYEALMRGAEGQSASEMSEMVDENNCYAVDQTCRVTAIDLASRLGLESMLSINFLPGAVYKPETCIRATLEAAAEMKFPPERLMFEVTESEKVIDHVHLKSIFVEYRRQGFTTAIDNFGAGHSGLNLLADFQPDIVKLDMALTRNVDRDRVRRAIVSGIVRMCEELSIDVIAEGIETPSECLALQDEGIALFQGYLFARPGLRSFLRCQPPSGLRSNLAVAATAATAATAALHFAVDDPLASFSRQTAALHRRISQPSMTRSRPAALARYSAASARAYKTS